MSAEVDEHGFVSLRVHCVERDTDESALVTFESPPGTMSFRHGQHLTLRRTFDGVELRRSYSICSPAPDGALRVGIRAVPGGVFSQWALSSLAPGDSVDAMAPAGHFTHELEPGSARRYTFVAAGSGITPIFSILATVLRCEPNSTATLWYLNRTAATTMLLDDLHDLRDRHLGRLSLAFAFTRDDTPGELLSGRPDRERFDRLITSGVIPADVDHAFLCGPIDLIGDAADALAAAGLAKQRIHRELFTTGQPGAVRSGPRPVSAAGSAVANGRVTLHGRATAFDIYSGDTVLEAVQRVRPDAPYSCRSGVCSTCQAIVRTGQVSMAVNHALTPDEVERGYVLTCQSQPLTDELHVDYDT